jgi:uncharacterized protein DUF5992
MKQSMWSFIVLIVSLGLMHIACADDFVNGGVINVMSNSRNGGDAAFVLSVTGATGPCATSWIGFYPTDFADAESFKRAFAIAMLAYTTGKTVRITSSLYSVASPANGDCWHANYIQIQG